MKLVINGTEYNLRLLCGKFRELKEALKSENLMVSISEAMSESDPDVMSKAFRVLCLDPKIVSDSAAGAIIDQYLEDNHTVMEFGNVLLEALDDSGFLPKRGMSAAVREKIGAAMDKAMAAIENPTGEAETPERPPVFQGFKA